MRWEGKAFDTFDAFWMGKELPEIKTISPLRVADKQIVLQIKKSCGFDFTKNRCTCINISFQEKF